VGAHVTEFNGEVIRIHLDFQDPPKGFVPSRWTVEQDFVQWFVGRKEKGEALNVVPVRVTDENVQGQRSGFEFLEEVVAELTDSGTGIEDDNLIIRP